MSGRAWAHARRSHASRSRGPGSSPGCSRRQLGFVAVDVAADLRGPGTERPDVRRELLDLAGLGSRVKPCAASTARNSGSVATAACPMPLIASIDVAHPDRVDAPPRAGRPDAGVDLQVEVPVRVPGPRRVVPDHRRLDLLDRHLHLPAPRPDPGRRVLGDPADDLGGGPVLGRVQRGRDLRVQGRGQRPGLRAVDDDLDEPQRVRVVADPTLLAPGVDVDPGDPLLVGRRRPSSPACSTPSGVAVSRSATPVPSAR